MDMKKIREAVEKNRGGLSEATDQQIKIIWDSLTDDTRHGYLKSIRKLTDEKKGAKNATSDRPEPNI